MKIKFLTGRKTLLFAVAAVGILFHSLVANGAVRPLDENELAKIPGGWETCTKYVMPLMCCFCTAGGGVGWNECAIYYLIYECESAPSGSCTNSNKYAVNIGRSWANRELALGRRCNNTWFCAVVHVRGGKLHWLKLLLVRVLRL